MPAATDRLGKLAGLHCLQIVDDVIGVYKDSLALVKFYKLTTAKEAILFDMSITVPVSSGGGLGGKPVLFI